MDTPKQNEPAADKKTATPPKKGPSKLPSKQISFSNQPVGKNGKQGKAQVNKAKKGGVNLMRKLSGM